MKLTITIPTYNRPEKIQKQVRWVLPQLRTNVRLIVYDNCSPIPVESLFTKTELEQFTIVRNSVNVGADANIARCLESVDDGWAWPLSDDDDLVEGAIDTIMQLLEGKDDFCYINFNKVYRITTGLKELLAYWEIIGTFNNSFFMSVCFFNMTLLRPYMRWYYEFLSSQMGQICLVIKYVELTSGSKCLFLDNMLISYTEVGGWDKFEIINNSSIIIDKFRYCKSTMRKGLFKALGDFYLNMLSSYNTSFSNRFHYLKYVFTKLGFFNTLWYNRLSLIKYIISRILPRTLYSTFRNKMAKKYNEKKR